MISQPCYVGIENNKKFDTLAKDASTASFVWLKSSFDIKNFGMQFHKRMDNKTILSVKHQHSKFMVKIPPKSLKTKKLDS